ncbi:methionyl-tRNA formyltransferase [Sphingomonas lutea]|uniref:Methionyl-tRNA formyltransferase n=1 Tax=Sphingomonas lutea TaxID=1045317 RepID=A0A7G9SFW9_9SPHN|nr:methionyl-tRNA formyltransferase [Sphingomonas lutea]QNN66744.1 methionyl-tRNA formyltransferase [Sphingomonas lutea]
MRIVFMGSPDFAVPSLEALVAAGHDVMAAYAQPPRPAGRGKAERKTAVHQRAEALGIAVRTPRTLRDAEEQARFRALDANLAVVAAYGLILPKAILDAPRKGCVNVHASLLPRWRGAAPIQRAILAGDAITGVTIMRMDEGLDTGPMLLKRELAIDGKTAGQVTEELAKLGAKALVDWLASPSAPVPQPEDGVTYASKIDKAEARIDWSRTAEEIERQVRAFAPTPGAWFEANGERIKLLDAECVDGVGTPGEVVGDPLVIACGEDAIHCRLVQRAGKGAMAVKDMLRGFAIAQGTILP